MATGVGAVAVVGGEVLIHGAVTPTPATVRWSGVRIDAVEPVAPTGDAGPGSEPGPVLDASGCWVLPGLVDLHGDAFERCLMPRPGVLADVDVALADNDRQLLASGITTSFLSATDSWEPGLRSRATLRRLIDGLDRRRGGPDVRLHVRHERCNIDGVDELIDWVTHGTIRMLSLNDHRQDRVTHQQVERSGIETIELAELLARAIAARPEGWRQEVQLADTARAAGCPTASHDQSTTDDLMRDLRLGVSLTEFPETVTLARAYREQGIAVVLGAPNLVRGRSHLGRLSVVDAVGAGVCDVLCSDYHYPSLLQAVCPRPASGGGGRGGDGDGAWSFARHWGRASEAAAAAAGLTDRGRIAPGARADVIVVEPPDPMAGAPPRVRAAVVGGNLVHLAA
jgi:alpha-D-ribose 1-methylphosphonate 5-triphosphate diphosphatase